MMPGQKNVLQNNANFNETYLTCLPKILDPSTDVGGAQLP